MIIPVVLKRLTGLISFSLQDSERVERLSTVYKRELHIKEDLRYFNCKKSGAMFCRYGSCIGGMSFDKIIVHTPPENLIQGEWLECVALTRLSAGGEIIYKYDREEFDAFEG